MTPTATPIRAGRSRKGVAYAVVQCPYCGKPHTHGVMPGTRVAHCSAGRGLTYRVPEVDQ